MKILKITPIILLCILMSSCGGSQPNISHITVKSDSQGVVLDTDDSAIISTLQKIFYEKQEAPDAGPEFKFFVDFTIKGKNTRWQYSIDGYIRNYEENHSMIYQLRDVAEFNRTANIR